ncbi:MAG: ATP synthase F1 subunit epsilon [Lachnospiraceae bacterium]|jgi:F-type H+-transporting ATPase subunit epsilon|nr:ATP synthase F1 subunit epsilon [Lachnospiraceae bacterium]MDE7020728.1 ATP synthase F1 subunit epsilon [Lachnospiraceae bacterium]
MAENDNRFTLKVITPDRVFYEEEVSMVEFNTVEGEVGIYKQHIPMTMIISPGILTITQENETREAALHAGFAEVLQDKVTILAEIIEWPAEIDLKRAEEAKERAESRIREHAPGTDMKRAEMSLKRAVARINAINEQ